MWSKLTQAAGLGPSTTDPTVSENSSVMDAEEQIAQQNAENQKLKVMVRENEALLQEKNKELEEANLKLQKLKLQSKAKMYQLNNRLKELEKSTKRDNVDFEDTSSSDSSDQSKRGKVIVLKKQLEQARQLIEKKEKEIAEVSQNYEAVVKDLHAELSDIKKKIAVEKADLSLLNVGNESKDIPQQGGTDIQEMYAQIVYKDSKIIELNNHILENERTIMDLQEHIKEKEEVLQSRNRAFQLMTVEIGRKGKCIVDELEEIREQMRIMQENFTIAEAKWKIEKESLKQELKETKDNFEKDTAERNLKIKNYEEACKKLEAARYELATKNAELQRRLVVVQENADKQCEAFENQIKEEYKSLTRCSEEKDHSLELQKALEEAASQSETKVLKARIKERTKLKALERELATIKQAHDHAPEEVMHLHQHVAELEEEKGTLQLKLIELEEQVALHGETFQKEDLFCQLSKLQEMLNSSKLSIINLEKENNGLKEKVIEFEKLCENERQESQKVIHQSNCFQEELNELQAKYHNVMEESEKFKLENDVLVSALNDKEEMLKEMHILGKNVDINDGKDLGIASVMEKYNSLQVLLSDLLSLCFVSDLNELKRKYLDMTENVKDLSSSILDKDVEIERSRSEQKIMAGKIEKLQCDLQSRCNELQSCSEVIENLKQHVSDQEKVYKDEINKLSESIEDKDMEKLHFINAINANEKSLQKASIDIQEKENIIQNLTGTIEEQSNLISQLEKQNMLSSSKIDCLRESRKADADMQSKFSSMLEQITDLETEVSKLQAEVSSKQQNCRDLEKRSSHFEVLYSSLVEEQQNQNSMLKHYEVVVENLKHQTSSLESELKMKNQEIETVCRTLKDEYEVEKCNLLRLNQDTINSLEVRLSELQTEKEELLSKNVKKETEITELETSFKELAHKLDLETNKSNDVLHKYECVNDENIKLNQQLCDALSHIQSLETEVSQVSVLSAGNDDLTKKLLSTNLTFENDLNHLKKENEILHHTSNEVKLENEQLAKKSEDLTNELKQEKNELSIVKKALQDKVLENKNLKQTVEEISKSLEICENEVEVINEKYSQLCKENRVLNEENKSQNDDLQEKVKCLQDENAEIKTEKNTQSDMLNNLMCEIDSCQHELLHAKAENEKFKSMLESEAKAKADLQEKICRYESTRKCLRNALLCAFKDNKQLKACLLNLKSEAKMQLKQCSSALELVRNELNAITNVYHMKENEFRTTVENSVREKVVLAEANDDISERLKNSVILVQKLTEERDSLQGLTIQLKQQLDNLMGEIVIKEKQYQLSLEQKMQEYDKLENAELEISELKHKLNASDAEKKQLQHIVEGLKENINMLISDNDTFQELVEKLSQSKAALEKEVVRLKESNPKDMIKPNRKLQSEVDELTARLQVAEEEKTTLSVVEGKYKLLEGRYSLLEDQNKFLENKIQDILNEKKILEHQNKGLYDEFCRKSDKLHSVSMSCAVGATNVSGPSQRSEKKSGESEVVEKEIFQHGSPLRIPVSEDLFQTTASQIEETNQNFSNLHALGVTNLQDLEEQMAALVKEKQSLELQTRFLTEELQSSMAKIEVALKEPLEKEKQLNQEKNELQHQNQTAYPKAQLLDSISPSDLRPEKELKPINNEKYHILETELQEAMSNLHRQGLRCEKLSLEVSKLLEERNDLKLKLSHYQQTQDVLLKSSLVSRDDFAYIDDELPVIKVKVPYENSYANIATSSGYIQSSDLQVDVTKLLEQLHQSEETHEKLCNENKALERALISEQEQRKLLEDELGFAKEHLVAGMKSPNDECRVLLGDFDEPELFVETTSSMARHMQFKVWKFHRWIRSRRNYLCSSVQGKYYCRFLYFFYLFALHVWIIWCALGN